MSTLFNRGLVLGISRVINYAALFISPLILVRILDVESYGQYREFVLYAMFAISIISFSIKGNLLYFIPKDVERERLYAINTVLLLFLSSLLGLFVLYAVKSWLIDKISFDFILFLGVYVFLYVNFDIIEGYWASKKRSDNVLKYTAVIVLVRLLGVVLTAYWTRDVVSIIYVMIAIEAVKAVGIIIWLFMANILTVNTNYGILKEQFTFIFPLWISAIVFFMSQELGRLYTSVNLGVVALAMYVIGGYPVPILNVLRASVSDVILPNMAEQKNIKNGDGLNLWRKSNILFCLVAFPAFIILFYYAEYLIKIGFTEEYTDATPIFRIYLVSMLLHCFEMSTPLKAINANKYFIVGNTISLLFNISLIYFMTTHFGLVGPALSLVFAELAMYFYTGSKIAKEYQISCAHLFNWWSIIRIALVSALGIPIFIIFELYIASPSVAFVLGVCFFGIVYILAINKMKINEANWLLGKVGINLG